MHRVRRASVMSFDGIVRDHFRYRLANTFWSRFIGFHAVPQGQALLIPDCQSVHGFLLKPRLRLYFLDASGRVLGIRRSFGGLQVARHPGCSAILESNFELQVRVGDQILSAVKPHTLQVDCRPRSSVVSVNQVRRRPPRGASAIEMMFVLPVLLFLMFVVIQIGLLWHSKYAVTHAAMTAARHASVSHGSEASIRDGLVRGLLPMLGRADSLSDLPAALLRVNQQLIQGRAMGWIQWEVLSPTRQSFDDWGEPVDRVLNPSAQAGEIEIPANPLSSLVQRRYPRTGSVGSVDGLPVGRASGQTLIDATTMKLHLQVGVPLRMPVAGSLLARSLALWSGCGWSIDHPSDRMGLIDFGAGRTPSILSPSIECRALGARDLRGEWDPRWPVKASAVIQMQSSPRRSLMTLRDRTTKNP